VLNRKKIGSDGIGDSHHCSAILVTGNRDKYNEIIRRLSIKMLGLLMSGFRGDELKRLTDEAVTRALTEIEQAGIEIEMKPLFGRWPLPPASRN
jgi:hypothetical protein